MADTFTKAERSKIMRSVRSRGNKSTELKLIKIFRELKITGWRRNYNLKGKPDFVFPAHKIVIFADGCFWHGHSCKKLKSLQNKEYWINKIKRNKARDKVVTKFLKKSGWIVIRFWECKIDSSKYKAILLDSFSRPHPLTSG